MFNSKNILIVAGSLSVALMLQACSSGAKSPTPGAGGSYLHVSVPDFYFGTRNIGTSATQVIEIANRGGDVYPINSVKVVGDNADEFSTDFYDKIILNPTEVIKLNVTFKPVTNGKKNAKLDIDFDTIKQVSDEVNQNEQRYYQAMDLENNKQFDESLQTYSDYVASKPVTPNKHRAAIKLPVIKEASLYGDGPDFSMYLTAMNARSAGELDRAVAELEAIEMLHSDSYIADDAAYLNAYIELMDKEDYAAAERKMKALRANYPDSNYYDTALYSEALAHMEMGNRQLARSIFEDLKYRHTGIDSLGFTFAKDNIISRMWFERADNALAELDG